MKQEKNYFVPFVLIGMGMVFVSGADSLFENPTGLFALSILLGGALGVICYAICLVASKITKKSLNKMIEDMIADEPLR